MTFFFWSISRIPIALALGGYFTGPIIATLLSCIFLKEPFNLRNIVSIGFCFMGIILIINPENLNAYSVFLSILSGFLYGLYIVLTRVSSVFLRSEDNLLIQNFFGFLLSFPLVVNDFLSAQYLTFNILFLVFLMGGLSFVSHFFSLISFKTLDVKTAAPFLYFEIIFSAIIGLIVFDDFPNLYSWVGIFLIVLGGVLTLKPMRKNHLESKEILN
jgi:drug/metabolite transporter (DMT)-like permease